MEFSISGNVTYLGSKINCIRFCMCASSCHIQRSTSIFKNLTCWEWHVRRRWDASGMWLWNDFSAKLSYINVPFIYAVRNGKCSYLQMCWYTAVYTWHLHIWWALVLCKVRRNAVTAQYTPACRIEDLSQRLFTRFSQKTLLGAAVKEYTYYINPYIISTYPTRKLSSRKSRCSPFRSETKNLTAETFPFQCCHLLVLRPPCRKLNQFNLWDGN